MASKKAIAITAVVIIIIALLAQSILTKISAVLTAFLKIGIKAIVKLAVEGVKLAIGLVKPVVTVFKVAVKAVEKAMVKAAEKAAVKAAEKAAAKAAEKAAVKVAEKAAVKAAEKAAVKAAEKAAAKAAEKAAVKIAEKAAVKTTGNIAKKIPFVGLAVGIGFGAWRIIENPTSFSTYVKAGLEVVSGVVSIVPGGGTLASATIDIGLAVDDVRDAGKK